MFASLSALGQHNHYIYIQSDNAQNFYIRKGGELISSSASGFVILPRIEPGQQEFLVGFPKNQFPEYQFAIEIKGKDRGFALKNFNEKGWGLFDLQSLDVIMGKKIEPKKEETKTETGPLTDDPFSVILASAVGDQRIRQTSLVYREEITAQHNPPVKPETSNNKNQAAPATESVVVKTTAPAKSEPVVINPDITSKKDPVAVNSPLPPASDATAKKTSETAKKEEVVTNTTAPVKNEVVAKQTAEPAQKEESVPATIDKPKADTMLAKSTVMPPGEAGAEKKRGLFKKNPFAKKTADPVKAEPGVVMITGAAGNGGKETGQEKKEAESVKEGGITADEPTISTVPKDSVGVTESASVTKLPYVIKFSEFKSGRETVLVYIDHQSASDDTIRLSITEDSIVSLDNDPVTAKDTAVVVAREEPGAAIDSSTLEKGKDSVLAVRKAEVRTDCRRMASEKDMVAMRKKMIMMADEDEMVALALKDFKQRCYSTERIQNMSYVFTTDKGRYKLFDAAFPYVYDPSNFPQLERLLNEEYYINRFRALINK